MARGGKREGAGRRPRFGQYKETTTIRVPTLLKQDVITYIENLCNETHQSSPYDSVTLSKDQLAEIADILNAGLKLKANAGGKIKIEIRKALKIIGMPEQ